MGRSGRPGRHRPGGRRQIALSFDQAPARSTTSTASASDDPFAENIRGNGDDVQVVLTEGLDGQPLTPGTQYSFQVKATRLFYVWERRGHTSRRARSAPPPPPRPRRQASRSPPRRRPSPPPTARFGWTIDANEAGEAPYCVLDATENSGTEVPCTATGAAVAASPSARTS